MNKQSGNVLFLILIAVALFAALSYAVTKSSSGGGSIQKEKLSLLVSEVLQGGALIEAGLMRVMITQGFSESGVSFVHSGLASLQNTACSSSSCELFSSENISYPTPSEELEEENPVSPGMAWGFTGLNCIPGVGTGIAGCSTDGIDNEELVLFLVELDRQVCIALNNAVGVDNPSGEPPLSSDSIAGSWNTTTQYADGNELIDAGSALYGKSSGCFRKVAFGRTFYQYYKVLIAN